MTKVANRISRQTQRRKVALRNLEQGTGKQAYPSGYNRGAVIATLREQIDNAPIGTVRTKKNRSEQGKKKTN